MKYSYDIKYDTKLNQFIYESLTSKDIILYKRDLLNQRLNRHIGDLLI